MLELYMVDIRESILPEQYKEWLLKISVEQRMRVEKFRYVEDAKRTLYGDILIRYLIGQKLNLKNTNIQIQRNAYGKPFLKGYPIFHYNISHSGKWVICALSRYPVGVDIEQIKSIDLEIAKRYFTRGEYVSILNIPEIRRSNAFFRIWTAKESYVKYAGKGLSIPLNSFAVSLEKSITQTVDIDKTCAIKTLETIDDQYIVSLCYCIKAAEQLSIQKIKLGDIRL